MLPQYKQRQQCHKHTTIATITVIAAGTSKTDSHTSQTTTPPNSFGLSHTATYSSPPNSSSHMHTAHGVHPGVQARVIDGTLETSRLRAGRSKYCAGRLLASLGIHPGMDGLDEAFASTFCLEFVSSERLVLPSSNCTYYSSVGILASQLPVQLHPHDVL